MRATYRSKWRYWPRHGVDLSYVRVAVYILRYIQHGKSLDFVELIHGMCCTVSHNTVQKDRWDHGSAPVLLFSKINKIFFGYFDSEKMLQILKICNLRGNLTDTSAIKKPLERTLWMISSFSWLAKKIACTHLWVKSLSVKFQSKNAAQFPATYYLLWTRVHNTACLAYRPLLHIASTACGLCSLVTLFVLCSLGSQEVWRWIPSMEWEQSGQV